MRQSALHIAAKLGHTDLVSALLEMGADMGAKDFMGRTSWDLARIHGEKTACAALERWAAGNPQLLRFVG